MLIEHLGKRPQIHPSAVIAPDATVCGDVVIGEGTCILHGASVIAEGGTLRIGRQCIVLENAVVRSTERHHANIGDHCLIGPNAHVVGCMVENCVFIATGAAIFHGAHLEAECEVRVNGVVHTKSRLPRAATVPIGWVAVGDPAEILPPNEHDRIWQLLKPMEFPKTVYGIDRLDNEQANMKDVTARLSALYAAHRDDRVL